MTERSEGARESPLALARRQRAAASAVLLDRRCDAAEAAPHLALGWLALARHHRPGAALDTLADALDDLPLGGLSADEQGEVRQTAPILAEALKGQLRGRSFTPPDAGALKRQTYLLHRAVGAAAPATRARLPVVMVALVLLCAVAAALLMTMDSRTGWRGHYFPNTDLRPPARVRHDPWVRFDWRAGAPMARMPRDHFAVRWETCLTLPSPRSLQLMVGSNDGARVTLNGKIVIDNWKLQYFTWRSHKAKLPAGAHLLQVEYFENTGDARVELKVQDLDAQAPLPRKHFELPREGGRGADACKAR